MPFKDEAVQRFGEKICNIKKQILYGGSITTSKRDLTREEIAAKAAENGEEPKKKGWFGW